MVSTLGKGISFGILGGFIGAIILGAIASMMPVNGVPFFVAAVMMMGITGSMATAAGWIMHLITGIIIGAIFGTVVTKVSKLQASNIGKGLGLGVAAGITVWVVFFVPMASALASSMHMSLMSMGATMIEGSFLGHLIFGLALGGVVGALLPKELATGSKYSCSACGASFSSQSGLMDHKKKAHMAVAVVSTAEQQQFKCNACGMLFNSQSEVMDHAKKMHPMPAR